jgi:hypothetical protein
MKLYLESFDAYVTDKRSVSIWFTVLRAEMDDFAKIAAPFTDRIDLRVVSFEDVLAKFGISESPDILLAECGKFSFQTLKKFYTMLYSDADRFLVLDSESMWVRPTDMKKMFDDFFAAPFVSGSDLRKRPPLSKFSLDVVEASNELLGSTVPYWFLENFVWFYDRAILRDLIKGEKEFLKAVKRLSSGRTGVFEIQLYQAFVWLNREKYGYRFNDCMERLEEALGKNAADKYLAEFHRYFEGNCGIMEHAMLLLDKRNTVPLATLFKNLRFDVIRCNRMERYPLQRRFMGIVQPAILAASQEHLFGLNAAPGIRSAQAMEHAEKHFREFLRPFHNTLKWIVEPFAALSYLLKAAVWRAFAALRR